MLDPLQLSIIKATVPLLESGGEALTTHFYQLLFSEHPEVRPLFNAAHQVSGTQPRALAHAVLMYARHIDQLEKLRDLPTRIVQKHVSLQIQAEHYPLVGACLLRAIREVLGEGIATDEVLEAWGAAYGQLADLLIAAESRVYAEKAQAPGGWRGARSFRVVRKTPESTEITSFLLTPADGGAPMDFLPGQFIGLRLVLEGVEQRRNYSLSAAPDGRHYRISVKREPGGRVSNHLHDHVQVGDTLEVFPPAGEFTLRPGIRPVVLISGGVGITPTLALLEATLPTGRPVHFIHCARNAHVHAFREWVEAQAQRHPQLRHFSCHDEATPGAAPPEALGRLTLERLARWLPPGRDVDVYLLGPKPFMASVLRCVKQLGVPSEQCHVEFFGPAEELIDNRAPAESKPVAAAA